MDGKENRNTGLTKGACCVGVVDGTMSFAKKYSLLIPFSTRPLLCPRTAERHAFTAMRFNRNISPKTRIAILFVRFSNFLQCEIATELDREMQISTGKPAESHNMKTQFQKRNMKLQLRI